MSSFTDLCCIAPPATIAEAIKALEENLKGIVLVCDADRRLLGTVSDGDIRRAFLRGTSLATPISTILAFKQGAGYGQPVTAPAGTSRAQLARLMHEHTIRQMPLLDADGRVVNLVILDDLIESSESAMHAVVMAGGCGTRLQPLTNEVPKPMLPVGEIPLLERILTQLKDTGITDVSISTYYLPDKITGHFKDGAGLGIKLQYLQESEPLGTAGALRMLERPSHPLLVINGDILTRVDYQAMRQYHQEHRALVTVGVRQYAFKVPYAVIRQQDGLARSLSEKPTVEFLVNAGLYILEPEVLDLIPGSGRFDMTDLIQLLLDGQKPVATFPIHEYWLDIGQWEDYQKAQVDYAPAKAP